MHGEPVGTTTASMIASLPADLDTPWPIWISFASPCTGIFLPIYIDGVIPASLARGSDRAARPEDDSAWHVFHRLFEVASRDFERSLPLLRAGWADLESRIEHEREAIEREASTLFAASERVEATGLLSDFMSRVAADALDRAHSLRRDLEAQTRTAAG
jgi:dipeptidase